MNHQPIYVGVDDGHHSIKVFTETGNMVCIPSRAATGRHLISWKGDDESSGFYDTEEGVTYTVNEYLPKYEDTRFKDYPKSSLNRVLVHHALKKAGLGGREVVIATGLPVSYYYFANGQKNETLIAAKVSNLGRKVTSSGALPMSSIIRNFVATEAIAAFFDQLMDIDGNPSNNYELLMQSTVGVIDVGGKTTDCAVIYPGGSHVDASRSGSSEAGVLQLNDAIEAKLMSLFDLDNVPPKMIEAAIACGEVKIAGETKDVASLVNDEKERLADRIMAGVRTKIGSGNDLDIVLFVGGGAIVMRDQLAKHYPHSTFPEQPEFANARGMYKIARFVFGGSA